eukprot:3029851-Pleurochrysis_carterae.AAC.4
MPRSDAHDNAAAHAAPHAHPCTASCAQLHTSKPPAREAHSRASFENLPVQEGTRAGDGGFWRTLESKSPAPPQPSS